MGAAVAEDRPRCLAKPIGTQELDETVWRDVSDQQVRIVYRVNTLPFVNAPMGAFRKIVVGVPTLFFIQTIFS
jgi:hypothetical protein